MTTLATRVTTRRVGSVDAELYGPRILLYLRLFTEGHIWRPSRNDVDSSPKPTLETTLETAKARYNVQKESLRGAFSAKRAIDATSNITGRNLFFGPPLSDEHVARFGPPMRGPGY